MEHGSELTYVFIAALALLLGAGARLLSSRTRFPYTIAMLLIGAAVGIGLEHLPTSVWGYKVLSRAASGAEIGPNLIIFAFLPALVFESAYSIDVHEFRKNIGAVMLLAAPAIVLSCVAVAAFMVLLTGGSWHWGWAAALVFGALISATDPVAVVAILRELGVSKRLGVLIEGESLLNDGTSIVIFSVLITFLTGQSASFSLGGAVLKFAWVVIGGIAVGLVLAFILSKWIEHVFNDPLSEITLTLVLAYASMILAEGVLHVSGVMAVVVAGLWMSGEGRTKISPEVSHFLHRFWETLGYIANTMIFFIVGLVIAKQVYAASLMDLVLIVVAYAGVMAIRAVIVFVFQPLTTRTSDGVSWRDCSVISWGGLRGAVSLALALVVAQHPDIDPALRGQVLLVTAGVVLLTILINGSTMGKLLARLGYSTPSLAEELGGLQARAAVLDDLSNRLEQAKTGRDLRAVSWGEVQSDVAKQRKETSREIERLGEKLAVAPPEERAASHWRAALSVERRAYWEAFSEGTLGATAVKLLSVEIDRQLDAIGRGKLAPPASRIPDLSSLWARLLYGWQQHGFDRQALLYDLHRAEGLAAAKVLATVGVAAPGDEVVESIEATYRQYALTAKERLEDMRSNLPEVCAAIETRLAKRIRLNFEREGYNKLVKQGVLDAGAAEEETQRVDGAMASLKWSAQRVPIAETADLVASTQLFQSFGPSDLEELAVITEEMVLPAGEVLFREGDRADSMFVIARGAVHVLKNIRGKETVVQVLGGGDIIGEMSLLGGTRRTACIRAVNTVTLGKITREAFLRLLGKQPELCQHTYEGFARRSFANCILPLPAFRHLAGQAWTKWLDAGTHCVVAKGATIAIEEATPWLFVLKGSVDGAGPRRSAVSMATVAPGTELVAVDDVHVVLLPNLEEGGARSEEDLVHRFD